MPRNRCPNDNHGRAIITIRHCPSCGVVVNESILSTTCAGDKHVGRRRSRHAFCMDCGEELARQRPGR